MRKLKIFAADNEKILCRNIEYYCAVSDDMEFSGCASDGEDALFKINVCRPDVLVTDIILPKLDGLALLERLRQLPGPKPKIIVCSVLDNPDIIRKAVQLGASYYLLKPFTLSELHRKILLVSEGASALPDRRENIRICLSALTDGVIDKNNSLGFNYLFEALVILDSIQCSFPLSKTVYAPVGKLFGSSAASVEALLRKTKDRLLSDTRIRSMLGGREHMKNTEFLTLLKDYIRSRI